jgi:anti-sigma factor RsiW
LEKAKMKSHLLDPWPLDESDMSEADRERLERELAESPELQKELSTWQAIEASIQETPMANPEPGFTRRWQARLAARRERRSQRQVNWLLGFLMMGAFSALLLIGLDTLASPAQFGSAVIESVLRVGKLIGSGARYLAILGDGWPALVGALALSAALAWVSVLWVAAMYRYAFGQIQNGVR